MIWILGLAVASAGTYALRVAGVGLLRGRSMSPRLASGLRLAALGLMACLAVSSASTASTTATPWAATIGLAVTVATARAGRGTTTVIAIGMLTFWATSLVG